MNSPFEADAVDPVFVWEHLKIDKSDIAVACMLAGTVAMLAGTRSVHYLLFHTTIELISIVVSFLIFALAWTSRRYLTNGYLDRQTQRRG